MLVSVLAGNPTSGPEEDRGGPESISRGPNGRPRGLLQELETKPREEDRGRKVGQRHRIGLKTAFKGDRMSAAAKTIRMVIMGAPGSGKGTLTSRLLKKLPQIHSLSTGDILRQEIAKGSAIGTTAKSFISRGDLLPDEFMARLVENELQAQKWLDGKTSFLLDGFPRTVAQAEELVPVLKPHGADINFVVELSVPPEVILERIDNRWVHSSGRVYNLQYNPPKVPFKDDLTGEPLFKRPDDNPETFKVRLDKYFAELKPIRDYYEKQGVYHVVRGETSDIIFPKLYALVEKQLAP